MGFFSGLFRSRDKPQNRPTGSAYSFFFGGSFSGKRVNERSAMQMTAVYSCVRILAEAVAGLPLHLYRYKEDGGKEKALDHPLYLLLHDEPNPEMSSFVFRETLMTHLLLWGNAYAQIIRNGRGEVMALYPLMPDRMAVDRDDKEQLYYEYTTSADDAPISKGSIVRLKSIVWRCISRLEPISAEKSCTNRTVNELLLQEITVKAINQILTERDFFLKTLQQNIAKAVVGADTLSVCRSSSSISASTSLPYFSIIRAINAAHFSIFRRLTASSLARRSSFLCLISSSVIAGKPPVFCGRSPFPAM